MQRRPFLYHLGAGLVTSIIRSNIPSPYSPSKSSLSPDNPKAIAMWDFSWLLRQYRGGGFEDWDRALDELTDRGYNALRIDCFPQFIGKNNDGVVADNYRLPKKNWRPSLWENEYTVDINPQSSLISFLKKCNERDITYVLSSWFLGHGTNRNLSFSGVDGLVDAWQDVLELVNNEQLLDGLLYVDILNEYPLWHGYRWLTDQLEKIRPNKSAASDFLNDQNKNRFDSRQVLFYNQFLTDVIKRLKKNWPNLKFTASQTNTLNTPWQDLKTDNLDVLDIHLWMVYNKRFSKHSGYFKNIHPLKNDLEFRATQDRISQYSKQNHRELSRWLEDGIKARSEWARDKNLPLGNSEGWGAIMWMDHPDLNWNFIKESGIMAAHLGVKYGYSFNCSSNFTHPQFGLWKDKSWHREVTSIIRKL